MDFELIDNTHLRVTVKRESLTKHGLTYDMSSYKDEASRRLIKTILYKAHQITGFCYTECKLIIEVFPISDGGCEIYFTRCPRVARLKRKNGGVSYIIRFSDAEAFIRCAECINQQFIGDIVANSLYFSGKEYYLYVQLSDGLNDNLVMDLCEFGEIAEVQNHEYYKERMSMISDCAIQKMRKVLHNRKIYNQYN